MEGGNKSLKSLIEAEMRSKKIVENAQQAQSEKLNKASLEAQKLVQDYQMKLDEAYEAEKQRVSSLKSLIRSVER